MAIPDISFPNSSFKFPKSPCFKKIWPIALKVSDYVVSFLKKHSFAIAIGFFVSHAYYTKIAGRSSVKEKTITSLIYGFLASASCIGIYFLSSKITFLTLPHFMRFSSYIVLSIEALLLGRLILVILSPSEERDLFK